MRLAQETTACKTAWVTEEKRRGWEEVTREKKHSARLVDQVSYLDSVCPKPSHPKEMWAPIQQLVKPHAQPTTSMQSQSHTSKPTHILVELYLITHTQIWHWNTVQLHPIIIVRINMHVTCVSTCVCVYCVLVYDRPGGYNTSVHMNHKSNNTFTSYRACTSECVMGFFFGYARFENARVVVMETK